MSLRVTMLPIAMTSLLAAGCAGNIFQPPEPEAAIKTYYEAHASEKNGRCKAPYIDGFTHIEVIDDSPSQMVVEAGYLFRDWIRNREARGGRNHSECVAFNTRRFLLVKSDAGYLVTAMSDPERG